MKTKNLAMGLWLACALCLSSVAAFAQDATAARTEDVSSLDGLMRAYYDVVSGGPNVARDVQRDLSLHHPDAALFIQSRNAKKESVLKHFTVQEYHANSKAFFDSGFFENEIKREVKQFGHSIQVWSTYEMRKTLDGPVIGRGINNLMLSFDGKRYWILAETWDNETKDHPIP
ncbi:nuclear transport factor 2 family protein [Undibacterium flavidum]|uniref:Nuclear transport factor 2 family protein n=1 Tax=Undibacterium flavidum TaxID=2762297 RepID=A0ABR6YAY3_9BURK|nr:nuclear transport factor 2 family protein [Undibacterium flavidum]MBC3873793.1 nuclear transport factor 2 family protein [Undibacterium flavidum]